MNLHELHLPENHRDTIIRFLALCGEDDRILAAFLGGSHARNETDRFSDLDLFFVTTDEAYEDFLAGKESFIRRLGEPLLMEDFGLPHGYCVIFSNGTEGDIWFGCESNFKGIYSGAYKVLMDKKDILAEEVFPPRMAGHTRQIELLREQIAWFWHDLSHFIKAMGRKQLWFASGQIEEMRKICVILTRLRLNFSDADLSEPYFKVEQALPVEELSPLQTTFCPMEYDAMFQAVQVICRFYMDIAPSLAKAHDLPYPLELERMMMHELEGLGKE